MNRGQINKAKTLIRNDVPTLMQIIQSVGLTNGLVNAIDLGDSQCVHPGYQQLNDLSGNNNNWLYGAALGAETTDPVFVGTRGRMSDKEYVSGPRGSILDEGRRFINTTINDNGWHQNNGAFSAVFVCSLGPKYTAGELEHIFLHNCNTITALADNGIAFWLHPGNLASFLTVLTDPGTGANDAQTTALTLPNEAALPKNTPLFCGVSYNEAGPTVILRFCGQTSSTTTTASVNVTNPASNLTVGGFAGSEDDGMTENHRYHLWAIWSTALTSTNLEHLYLALKTQRFTGMF